MEDGKEGDMGSLPLIKRKDFGLCLHYS